MTDIDGLIAGLLSPEYGIADMPLIREAADALAAQQREIEELKHDLSRYMDIANEHVNAAADAEKQNAEHLEAMRWVESTLDDTSFHGIEYARYTAHRYLRTYLDRVVLSARSLLEEGQG